MTFTLILIAAFIFMAAMIFAFAITNGSDRGAADAFSKRLSAIQKTDLAGSRENDTLQMSGKRGEASDFDLEAIVRRMAVGRRVDTLILHSDSRLSLRKFILLSMGCACMVGTLAAFLVGGILLTAAASATAGSLPYAVLRRKRLRRLTQFEASLPEAIALMSRCLRAGHSIASALEIISDQSTGPLSREFARVSQQQRLGVMFRESVLELAGRVPSQDLHFLVTAILVQRESGGDLTEILDGATRVISDRMRIAAQVRVHSAQGRLSGWILSALPFIMFFLINLLNPGYSRLLFSDPTGRLLLYGGLCSIGAGILMIRKIVNVKV